MDTVSHVYDYVFVIVYMELSAFVSAICSSNHFSLSNFLFSSKFLFAASSGCGGGAEDGAIVRSISAGFESMYARLISRAARLIPLTPTILRGVLFGASDGTFFLRAVDVTPTTTEAALLGPTACPFSAAARRFAGEA